ncbi:hypothetical protein EXIGLDRAFT_668520 [Exidia glandulosa HHB12029]|uniref:Signal recognition particle subunit SRP72 n=1 Tax=Exidia glandulosa HHB12029 TaxID=1314781 RepID=A0A165MJY3_EXIGL|nr:hypothetical protein EXIGLDRAFT_668520 [Exidia glandulosa HHB12029]
MSAPATKAKPARKAGKFTPKRTTKGKEFTPRAPRSTEDRLKRLFVSLTAQIDGAHFKNAIRTCNKILVLAPNDADVLQTKLFLLLQTEDYAAALDLASAPEHRFQKAYALYRLNRETDAGEVVKELKAVELDDDAARGVEHLEAQLEYRQGDYDGAVKTYTHLLDTCAPQSDEQSDLLTNLSAAQAHLDFLTSGFQSSIASLPATVIQSLETAPPPSAAPTASHPTTAVVTTSPAPTRKGPRPSRVPKGVVPGVTPPPDPERWIKKSERTNVVVHSRKKGKKVVGAAGTTQGAAVVEQPQPSAGGGGGGKKKKR